MQARTVRVIPVALVLVACGGGPSTPAEPDPGPWQTDTLTFTGAWSPPLTHQLHAGTEWERTVSNAFIPSIDVAVTAPDGYEYSSAGLIVCQAELRDYRGPGDKIRDKASSHGCKVSLQSAHTQSLRLQYPADTLRGLSPPDGDPQPHARPLWVVETVRRTR